MSTSHELDIGQSAAQNGGSPRPPDRSVQYGEPDLSWVDVLLDEANTVTGKIGVCGGEDTNCFSPSDRSDFILGGSALVFIEAGIWVFNAKTKNAGNPWQKTF